jgi:transforming growth factor-beta-induced protein
MERKGSILILTLLIGIAVLFAGCAQQQQVPVTPAPTTTAPATTAPVTPAPMKNVVETAVADGRFTTLVAAVQAAGLAGTLSGPGPFTVFAPTDDAFKKLPAGTVETLLKDPQGQLKQILLYHVVSGKVMAADVVKLTSAKTVQGGSLPINVSGSTVTVDGAKVIITDVQTSNGVIHVIDTVMIPPKANIVETLAADGRFKTLVAAVQAAKLDGTLSGAGPFTLFAPTDAAFSQLPAGTVETLLKTPEGQLKQILLYHVVSGKVMAADVVKLTTAKTVQGKNVTISTKKGVMVNDANVTVTDIDTTNGVIHIIDKVLIPPA